MSPRSEELLTSARARLEAAGTLLGAGHPEAAVSAAYYAMLYAARAALSERDAHAKSHRGTWSRFADLYVRPGRFDKDVAALAATAQRRREAGDYDAKHIEADVAESTHADAQRFVAAIEDILAE